MASIIRRGEAYCLKYRDPERRQRWESFKTRKAAERRKVEIDHQLQNESYVDPQNLRRTVAEVWQSYQTNHWGKLRLSTQAIYELTWRLHVAPLWAHRRLRSIGTEEIETWQTGLLAKGTGTRTVENAMFLLGQLFRQALRYSWVAASPVAVATKTRSHVIRAAFTPEQVAALIEAADVDTSLIIRFTAVTGLRYGEVMGLRWSDVDFESKRINVARQFTDGRFCEPKSKKGTRQVPLSIDLVRELRVWKLRCPHSEHGLVFPLANGSPRAKNNFRNRIWVPLLKRAGVKGVFHQLRHSCGTALNHNGVNMKTIQQIMGHATIKTTADRYVDVLPEALEGVADRAAATLFAGVGSKMVAVAPVPAATGEGTGAQVVDFPEKRRSSSVGRAPDL